MSEYTGDKFKFMEYLLDNFIIYILVCRVLYLALEKDIWVYPILEVMNWTYRIVFFVLLWCFFLLLYKTGELITIKFWGKSRLHNSSWSPCGDFGHYLRCKSVLWFKKMVLAVICNKIDSKKIQAVNMM